METTENYVYKKEVDWSLLQEGLTLPIENQVIFGRNMGRFLKKGESKDIKLYLGGKPYKAIITNVNFAPRFNRKSDILQIRYSRNSEISSTLKTCFSKSYQCILAQRQVRPNGDRTMIRLPEEYKEYLAIYTTEYEDSYVLETIVVEDIYALKNVINGQEERVFEDSLNYDVIDNKASLIETDRTVKIRKLNRKIGDNLKLLYGYRCQICGLWIGENYDSRVIETHHIDYFVNSFNNDSNNQMIVCPNHHSIIHDVNPIFDKKKLIYIYPNGFKEGLILNMHL